MEDNIRSRSFGLQNASCTFQNLMRKVLGTYWRKFSITYLEDIIVYSDTEEEHLLHLALLFEKSYLEDSHFTLRTVTAITWHNHIKDTRSKLERWACLLGELTFIIEHRCGKDNQLADALPRQMYLPYCCGLG